jgi:hypothetical protein
VFSKRRSIRDITKIKDVELEKKMTHKKIELYNQTIKKLASNNFSEYNNLDLVSNK